MGSGPNGLAAAITIARAGRSVRVVEAKSTIGGGVRSSDSRASPFIHDHCSAIYPLGVGSPFFRSLALDRFGLEWIHPEIPLAHPLDDGSAAVLHRSLDETCTGLREDGPPYRALMEPLVRHWQALADEVLQPMLHLPRHPLLLARFGLPAIQSASRLVQRRFQGSAARALFAGLAAHSFLPLEAVASSAVALLLATLGHAVGWPFPRGGAQRITDALAAHLRQLGGVIETDCPISDLRDLGNSRAVLLDLTAWQLARLAGSGLRDSYRRRLAAFPHGPAVFKIDYALDAPIPWRAEACRRAGTVHLGGTHAEIATAEGSVARGLPAARPFVLLAQQSLFDPTRAPAGKHTAWAYCHIPRGCTIDATEAIEAQIERFAPGFQRCILARQISAPADLESANANLVDGDISGGGADLWHLIARPTLSFVPYRTPRRGIYMCSSSTPPGAGVHGMCGFHAAGAALGRELAGGGN